MWLKVYFNGDSCQITHRPESAVFCTLSLCLCFCHTWVESILFFGTVTNQTGQDDEEEPAVLEIEPLHSFFFFFSSEEYFFLLPKTLSTSEFSYASPVMLLGPSCATSLSNTLPRLAPSIWSCCSVPSIQTF